MDKFSINPFLRTDKKQKKRNGKYPVYLRIRIEGKESKIPTGLKFLKKIGMTRKSLLRIASFKGNSKQKLKK